MYVMSRTILITFIGMKDPYPAEDETPGPILSLLKNRSFNEIFVLCSSPAFLERAHDLERETKEEHIEGKVNPVDFPIEDVISYEEIWQKLIKVLDSINELMPSNLNEWYFLLDSRHSADESLPFACGKNRAVQGTNTAGNTSVPRTRHLSCTRHYRFDTFIAGTTQHLCCGS